MKVGKVEDGGIGTQGGGHLLRRDKSGGDWRAAQIPLDFGTLLQDG